VSKARQPAAFPGEEAVLPRCRPLRRRSKQSAAPFLIFLAIRFLFTLSSLTAQNTDGSPEPPFPRVRDPEPWYETLVLQGALLQEPLIIESPGGTQSLVLFTGDRRVQRYQFGVGVLWMYDIPRIPIGVWFPQENGSIHIPLSSGRTEVIDAAGGRLLYTAAGITRESESSRQEGSARRFVSNGRELLIAEDGTVTLISPVADGGEHRLRWVPGISGFREVLLDEGGELLFLGEEEIMRYSVDGALHASAVIASSWDTAYFSGGSLHLTDVSDGSWSIITPDLQSIQSGRHSGPGRFYTSFTASRSGRLLQLTLSYDARNLWMGDDSGAVYHLLRLEEQWNLLRITRSGNWLYLADSAWRVHRIDLTQLVRDFLDASALLRQPATPADPRPAFLLNLLKVSVDQPRELTRQLEAISATIESGDYRGRLLLYERALSDFLAYSYGEGTGGGFILADPSLRALLMLTLLNCGGDSSAGEVIRALNSEVSPEVYRAVLEAMAGRPHPDELRLARQSLSFIISAESWQRPAALVRAYFDFLMALLEPSDVLVRGIETRREVIDLAQNLYGLLDDPVMRRQILRLNS
jgi:hypothetical protein